MKNKIKVLLSVLITVLVLTSLFVFNALATDADPEETEVVAGDVNSDGAVDSRDLIQLRKYLANYNYVTKEPPFDVGQGADINRDGKLDLLDIVALRDQLASEDLPGEDESETEADTRPALEDIAFGSSIKVNNASAITPSSKKGAQTVTDATVDYSCQININGWCAVDGGVYKYVWSADGGVTWREDFVNGERIKDTATEAIVTTGQAYSGKTFTDIAGAYTNAQFQNGGIGIDLSAYAKQTVDVIFAAVPIVNQDVKIILVTIKDISCPAAVSDAYFGASVRVNDGTVLNPSTSKGIMNVADATVDESNLIKVSGWCSVDGGISKYVWSVDGVNWHDVDLTLVTGDYVRDVTGSEVTAVPTTAQAYSGKTFTDLEGAVTNARFVIHIDLSEYAGSAVTVTFAAVPVKDADNVTPVLTVKDVAVPSAQ